MKVGLMLPIGEQEKTGRTLPWSELREMALAAEESGHLIVHLWPPTAAAVRELGRAAEVARADVRIAAHG